MAEHVLEIHNLRRQFGSKVALDDVTLSVPRGIVLGLVGGNGAGKTTLIKHILGMLKAKSGTVRVFDMNPVTEPARVLARIGYMSEDRDLPPWMRVDQLLAYTQAFYPSWDEGFAEKLRKTFGLDPKQKIADLSRGEKAKAGLLIALAHRPELLVLDEPSSGLDPVVRRDILAAIVRTVADEGRTVLFSSHLLDEVERVADKVAMIHRGKLVLSDSLEEILQSHTRITLRFQHSQSTPPTLAGALCATGEGTEWTFVCNGGIEQFRASAQAIGASVVDESSPSLDEIFVGHTAQ